MTSIFNPLVALTAKGGFDLVMTVLVILCLIGGVVKMVMAWNERDGGERFWGVIGGIGIAASVPVVWAIMAFGGWTPAISAGSTALP